MTPASKVQISIYMTVIFMFSVEAAEDTCRSLYDHTTTAIAWTADSIRHKFDPVHGYCELEYSKTKLCLLEPTTGEIPSTNCYDYDVDPSAEFDRFYDKPWMVVTHGWNPLKCNGTSREKTQPWAFCQEMWRRHGHQYHIVCTDWRITASNSYWHTIEYVNLVGEEIVRFLKTVDDRSVRVPQYVLIGHSLGSHVNARVAYLLKERCGFLAKKLVLLDAARPNFTHVDYADRAEFVLGIHSSYDEKVGLGLRKPIGNLDLFFEIAFMECPLPFGLSKLVFPEPCNHILVWEAYLAATEANNPMLLCTCRQGGTFRPFSRESLPHMRRRQWYAYLEGNFRNKTEAAELFQACNIVPGQWIPAPYDGTKSRKSRKFQYLDDCICGIATADMLDM